MPSGGQLEPQPPQQPVGADEPVYVSQSAPESAAAAPPPAAAPKRVSWVRPLFLAAAGVVIVAIGLITIATKESNAPPVGQATARAAAQHYVRAVNAGDRDAAVATSCASYANEARAEAQSGSDPGITFVLGAIRSTADSAAAKADVTERLTFKDTTQRVKHVLTLQRTDGRWLVCGQH